MTDMHHRMDKSLAAAEVWAKENEMKSLLKELPYLRRHTSIELNQVIKLLSSIKSKLVTSSIIAGKAQLRSTLTLKTCN